MGSNEKFGVQEENNKVHEEMKKPPREKLVGLNKRCFFLRLPFSSFCIFIGLLKLQF